MRPFLPSFSCRSWPGCGGEGSASADPSHSTTSAASEPTCPPGLARGWQKLADQIDAAVYCPSWLPDPLVGRIGGQWEGVHSVTKEGSYLVGFIWFERGAGEVHVNLRGYPGQTKVPTCNGKPCFSGERGTKEVAGRTVDVYTVNHGADTWHVVYTWKDDGSLYSVSQHVVPELGLSYSQVVKYLDRIMAGLVKIEPQQSRRASDQEAVRRGRRGGRSAQRGSTTSSTASRPRPSGRACGSSLSEQHVLGRPQVIVDNGVEVVVPPLHHEVVTARLNVEPAAAELAEARATLSETLQELDRATSPRRKGCRSASAGGSLLHALRPRLAEAHLPVDRPRVESGGRAGPRVIDAIRFPSDPEDLILEGNDVAIFLRSDSMDFIADGSARPLRRGEGALLDHEHPPGLRRRRLRREPEPAEADGDGGGDRRRRAHPRHGRALPRLHLDAEGGARPAGDRELRDAAGYTTSSPTATSSEGTAMHLSHLFEDVEAWYLNFDSPSAWRRRSSRGSTWRRGRRRFPRTPTTRTARRPSEQDAELRRPSGTARSCSRPRVCRRT